MNPKKLDDFFISEHSILIENLNRISDDLLKAKWYFLAAIASLGVGYSYIFQKTIDSIFIEHYKIILKKSYELPFTISIFALFLVGNIIFWLISEYIISHSFLFRYIQAKAAQKEFYFNNKISISNGKFKSKNKLFIRDPSNINKFVNIKNGTKFLNLDFFIPDQFIPIYWTSIWVIIINSILAIYLINDSDSFIIFFIPPLTLGFIFKILGYFIYKMNKFIYDDCTYRIFLKNYFNSKRKDFYSLPNVLDYSSCGLIISFLPLPFLIFMNLSVPFMIYIFLIIWLLWFPILGVIVHFVKIFLQVPFWDLKGPLINIEARKIIIDIDNSLIGTIKWVTYQLITII